MNTTIWLVRREFWENRAIWMIPAVIGGCMILAALFGRVEVPAIPTQIPGHTVVELFLVTIGGTFFAVMSIYSTWYLLDCLYADRKDRSVLFWKSLPISDTTTVLSKLAIGMIVIPVVCFLAADLATVIIAAIISARAGGSVARGLWHADVWLQLQVLWIYLIVITFLWFLPVAGYLLVVSAWAKRAVMLWSILPLIAFILIEHWFIGTNVVARLLEDRFLGWIPRAFHVNTDDPSWVTTIVGNDTIQTPASIWSLLNFHDFFASPATWIGAAAGCVLIACAIQLRKRNTEI